ncbi:MAG: hypothetical protein ACP5JY_01850 [Candidatus Nanoarchaeia archaeon]
MAYKTCAVLSNAPQSTFKLASPTSITLGINGLPCLKKKNIL